jgi:alkanesulfonate monooxygenase
MVTSRSPLRFHWSLPSSGGDRLRAARPHSQVDPVTDLPAQRAFTRQAEDAGIDSLLLPIGFHRADPLTLAGVLGMTTKRLTVMVASRSGIVSPTYFVQQVNTVAAVCAGRVSINVVLGRTSEELRYYGDFLDHDERYRRTDEFWTICDALWRREFPVDFAGEFLRVEGARITDHFTSPTRGKPEVYFSGSSDLTTQIAVKHGDCLLCFAEPPDDLIARIRPAQEHGLQVAIICTLIARPTRDQAIQAAHDLVHAAGERGKAVQRDVRRETAESVGFTRGYALGERESPWLTPYLWSGLVPYMGPPSVALIGDPDEITEAVFDYRRVGVTQFLFHGRPDLEAMTFFGQEILPRIRRRERTELTLSQAGAGYPYRRSASAPGRDDR